MIVFAADTHIGASMYSGVKELEYDWSLALGEFRKALELKRKQVKSLTLIIAGDMFDKTRITGVMIKQAREFVQSLEIAGIRTYAIQGNHELQEPVSLATSVGCLEIPKEGIVLDGKRVCALDYCDKDKLNSLLPTVPECDILVMHSAFSHLLKRVDSWLIEAKAIPSNIKEMVIAGDVHIQDTRVFDRDCGQKLIFGSPGSLFPTSSDERDPRGFLTLEDGVLLKEHIPNRIVYKKEIDTVEDLSKLEQTALEYVERPVPVIRLLAPASLKQEVIAAKIRLEGKVIIVPAFENRDLLEKEHKTGGMELDRLTDHQALDLYMNKDVKPETYTFLSELFATREQRAFILKFIGKEDTECLSLGV